MPWLFCQKKMKTCVAVYVDECFALYEALTFSLEMGLRNIMAEGDSSLTIDAVNSKTLDHSIAGGIVETIKLLSHHFISFRLIHVRRGGNAVAHSLAKHAKEVEDFEVWLEDTPNFLHALVLKDICNTNSTCVSNQCPIVEL
ncbi:hypothetical protein REPUB_Repub17cG0018500 [Reevesia pubescens]